MLVTKAYIFVTVTAYITMYNIINTFVSVSIIIILRRDARRELAHLKCKILLPFGINIIRSLHFYEIFTRQ